MQKPIQFGKYTLLDRINVGGMAEVFVAKVFGVEGFERLLAVKRILPSIAKDEEFINMFVDEAKIAVQLNHANICQIFDLGKVEDAYFIALEYVHGKDLRYIYDRVRQDLIEGQKTMPIAQACFIIMKACEGLDYAHNKKDAQGRELHLVHRDVSPQNVLISYEGEVKLIDFGIAKAANKGSKTQQGILKGKFGYMSPEQVRGLPLDRQSDIFSLGILLYELLTGERLFTGESDFAVIEMIRNVELQSPRSHNPKITDELERIVLKALAKDIDDRYANAIDLHDDLQAYMYSSGEFYSRKELAVWMKGVFANDIQEEDAKLENYRQMAREWNRVYESGADMSDAGISRPRRITPPPPVPSPSGRSVSGPNRLSNQWVVSGPVETGSSTSDLAWDEEELATNLYGDDAVDATDAVIEESTDVSSIGAHGNRTSHIRNGSTNGAVKRAIHGRAMTSGANSTATSSLKQKLVGAAIAVVIIAGAVAGYWAWINRGVQVVLTTEPNGPANLRIDNQAIPVEATPAKFSLAPGVYVLTIEREGFLTQNVALEVRGGQPMQKHIILTPALMVQVTSDPSGAKAYLDGKQMPGATPMKVPIGAEGKHSIEFVGRNGERIVRVIDVRAGGDLNLHVKFGDAGRPERNRGASGAASERAKPAAPAPAPVTEKPNAASAPHAEPANKGLPSLPAENLSTPKKAEKTENRSAPKLAPAAKPAATVAAAPSSPAAKPAATAAPAPASSSAPAKPAATGEGSLRIGSKPWTSIAIDGSDTGQHTPQTQIKLSAGTHQITLSNPQFQIRETFPVQIRAGETTTVVKTFSVPAAP